MEDYDQRQVERVSSRTVPEVELPRPGAGEEMDVGESMVDLPQPVNQFPQFEWVDHRAQKPSWSRCKSK